MRASIVATFVLLTMSAPSPAFPAGDLSRAPSPEPQAPFFLSGNGRLKLRHAHFKTSLDVEYRRGDGSYDAKALQRIRHFFRSRSDKREGDVSLRLIELLSFVQNRFRPRSMTLMSGYRSPQHNEGIRAGGAQAAKASLHTEGLAADVKLAGVNLRELWLRLRELESGGVGYYRSGAFLHLDTGPPRFWEETTSRVSEDLSAGNARVFARTEYDRYETLQGATIKLHNVTALPLRIAAQARLVGAQGSFDVTLSPGSGTALDGDCIAVRQYAPAYEVHAAASFRGKLHGRLLLTTCTPRLESTPEEIEANLIECENPKPMPEPMPKPKPS